MIFDLLIFDLLIFDFIKRFYEKIFDLLILSKDFIKEFIKRVQNKKNNNKRVYQKFKRIYQKVLILSKTVDQKI